MTLISSGIALYEARGSSGPWSYFLATEVGADPPETLTMDGSWELAGAYVIAAVAVPDSLSLEAMKTLLAVPPEGRILAWAHSWASPFDGPKVSMSAESMRVIGGGATIPFANVGLFLPNRTPLALTVDGLEFNSATIQFQRGGQGYNLPPQGGRVTVSVAAPDPGRLLLGASWRAFELFALCRDEFASTEPVRGGELRYFCGPGAQTLSYPLFAALEATDPRKLELDLALDPLAPFDGTRTHMLFRGAPPLECTYGATTAGTPVTLTPLAEGEERAGFYFGRRPQPSGEDAVYLAPLGPFALGDTPGEAIQLMCGTSGLEYLAVAVADRLVFTPGEAAFAPNFGVAVEGEAKPPLDPTYTTSWVRLAPRAGARSAVEPDRAYFGQPDASPNYGTGVVPGEGGRSMTLPAAVASRVREVEGETDSFPLVVYGGVLGPGDGPAPAPQTLMEFESFALAPERGVRLRAVPPPPGAGLTAAETAPPPPVFNDATGKPLTGRTTTPQGFVVGLQQSGAKPELLGTWEEVKFARSPTGQELKVPAGKEGFVDPWLASSLVKDQLFLVLNDWTKLPALDWLLSVGGFDFRLAPLEKEWAADAGTTILVLKYASTQSLTDLIGSTGAWYLKDHFIGGEKSVGAAQEALEGALRIAKEAERKEAEQKGEDPFVRFREIAADPTWTGMLVFGPLVPGTGMPADLQMLYAGMEGPLRAHHFGVELNRISREGEEAEIAESSLFGVIHYEGEARETTEPPPFQFVLKELEVAMRNSAVTQFHATVLLQANELFGRQVALTPTTTPANTISLAGQYQRHGTVGTVSFGISEPSGAAFGFAIPGQAEEPIRVLEKFTVGGASLVPVASESSTDPGAIAEDPEATKVEAQVSLSGSLFFAAEPVPNPKEPGLDLFSYGNEGLGVEVSGFGLLVSCEIFSSGKKGPTTIVPDLSGVVLKDPGKKARRPEGLVSKLPLTLKGLLHEEADGLDPTKLGALPVNVVQLAGAQGAVATRPRYALQFALPLGTLGGLADAHASLDASLILGWGPSTYSPDNDGIGLFVALPFVSAGAFGMNLQGLLKTTFGDANLARVKTGVGTEEEAAVYAVLFNNVAISVLGLKFPPRVIVDFILFAGPDSEGGGNLGWSLAALEPQPPGAARLPQAVG